MQAPEPEGKVAPKVGGRAAVGTLGWDVGGANLKTVALDRDGKVIEARELPTPLWRGLDTLERAIPQVLAGCNTDTCHALTMTGELADCFADRAEGVRELVLLVSERLPQDSLRLYTGTRGFVPAGECAGLEKDIASANWHATATLTADRLKDGVLVDIGSTTTDVVEFTDQRVVPAGYTDGERLARGSLVYTGAVRTPVCAVAERAPFKGNWHTLAAELFATMADVYRLSGELPAQADLHDTADGRGKSEAESASRLARMIGYDAEPGHVDPWRQLARYLARKQRERIADALALLVSGDGRASGQAKTDQDAGRASGRPLVGAGAGRFIARRLASELGHRYVDISEVFEVGDDVSQAVSTCAPAAAVALLARHGDRA
ncbi:MAG: hydantoinase/oxoprolinase family protein [Gammaproteobacteria bacterium]